MEIDKPKNPFFSIIIPTYNRPKQLITCLQSLAKLTGPRNRFEVIVVDDGSQEPLNATVKPFQAPIDLILINKQNGGPASARNLGAKIARGKFLAFTDDDCCPSTDWLTTLEARFEATPRSLIGGYTVNSLCENVFASTSQLIIDIVYDFYNEKPNQATLITSNNMAMSANLFAKIDGFDTSFPQAAAEDRDLCDRWLHAGNQIIYAAEIRVYHHHELGFWGFCKQHFNYGRGAFRFHCLRTQRGSGDMGSAFKFHSALPRLLRKPLAQFPLGWSANVCILLVVWQFANLIGFFYEKFR